ncbi:hypothetical protein BGZ80_002042 [Entomortierella chlamydospora]|uniref:Uncharacterized protein n=1 Tax=Entomortierella chlamydospora TaxID=101097 RepID=A0A9P6MQR2_9FUNG|nr:hypothetical protein BGZ80_002042 [Entomortierella chlamydospora]
MSTQAPSNTTPGNTTLTPQVKQEDTEPEFPTDFTTLMKSMAKRLRERKPKNQPGHGAKTKFAAKPVAKVSGNPKPPTPPTPPKLSTPPSPVKSGHFQYVHIANKGNSWNNNTSSLTSQRMLSLSGPSSARSPESIAAHQPTEFTQSWTNQQQQQQQQQHHEIYQMPDQRRSPFIATPQQPQTGPPRGSHSLPPRPSQAAVPSQAVAPSQASQASQAVVPAGLTKKARRKLRMKQTENAAAARSAAPPNHPVTVNSILSTSNSTRPLTTSLSDMQSDLLLSTAAQLPSNRPKTPRPILTRVTRSSKLMSSLAAQPADSHSSAPMSPPVAQPATNSTNNISPAIVSRGTTNDLDLELRPAMVKDTPIVLGNKISRKAAGECILRAIVYTLSRNYAFISKDLFVQLYCSNFGCPGLDDKPMISAGFLDHKMVTPIIQAQTVDHVKFYRLVPAYFERFGMQQTPPPTKNQTPLFADHNKSTLPPTQDLTPKALRALIEDFDTRFINIASNYPELCPSRLCGPARMQEFSQFIPIWYPELYPSAAVPPDLISPTKLKSMTDDELNKLQPGTLPPELFGSLLQTARGIGMAAKRARVTLLKHSAKVLQPLETKRLAARQQLLQGHNNTGNSPLTSKNFPGHNIPAPVSQQAEHVKVKNKEFVPSSGLTTAMENMSMDTDAQLPSFRSSTKAQELSPMLDVDVAPYTSDQFSVGSQQARIHSRVLSETMDISGETLTQGQDRTPKSVTQEHVKPSQGSRLRAMLKQERFKPYPSLNEADGSSALSKNGSNQKKVLPTHSKTSSGGGSSGSAENSNHRKEIDSLGYIPPSSDGIFTLPRPILPLLDMRARAMNGMPPMAPFDPSVSVVGVEESNLMMSGTLLRPTRDQILKERREALDQIIEYVWKLPMGAA